ncbi:MAG: cupin domain-containing protein [Candidatus Bathyarchaeia archaeon]
MPPLILSGEAIFMSGVSKPYPPPGLEWWTKKEPVLVKVSEVKAIVPPKHVESSSFPLIRTENMEVFITEMRPGAKAEVDVHPVSEHAFLVLSGRAKFVIEGKEYDLEPGMFIWMPPGVKHENWTVGDETLRMVVIFAPSRLKEKK